MSVDYYYYELAEMMSIAIVCRVHIDGRNASDCWAWRVCTAFTAENGMKYYAITNCICDLFALHCGPLSIGSNVLRAHCLIRIIQPTTLLLVFLLCFHPNINDFDCDGRQEETQFLLSINMLVTEWPDLLEIVGPN